MEKSKNKNLHLIRKSLQNDIIKHFKKNFEK